MECSSLFRLSNGLCNFSPNGLFTAICNHQRVTIYLVSDTKQALRVLQCSEIVEVSLLKIQPTLIIYLDIYLNYVVCFYKYIEWSADSELILSAYFKKGKLDVWSLTQPEWRCKIATGSLGLIAAQFAPSSRHVLTTAYLHVIS